ncbi:MAG: hypothetical protein Q8P59_00115, partial [Dehalococcoidia bacterium]|nr:hypothetical protein [Dehalococcoidia bacterium]
DGVTPVYLRLYREEGLVRLGWYLSPLGLLLGLAGFVRFAGTKLDRRSWPLLILFVTQLILYLLTAGMAYPVHFWASRRYVPLVIPALLFFASLSLASLRPSLRLDPRRWLVYLVPAALTLALLVSSVQTSARFLWQTEYQGALEGLERLSSRMENPALVFFQPRTEGNIFSAPLQNLFGKTAFVLQQEPQESFFSQGVERWLADGWKVYLVLTDKYPEYLSGDLTYSLVDDNGLAIRAMEQSFDHLPRETLPMSFPLRLYRLLPASGYPYRLDMGSLRIENSLRLRLPQPAGSGLRLSFRARTAGAEALLLSTSMDGKLQQRSLVEPETHLYQFDMPVQGTSNDGYHEITLSVDPPGAEKGGIMLEWFEAVDSQGS